MERPDLLSSSLTASEQQALEDFTLKANQWRLTEDNEKLIQQLASPSSSSKSRFGSFRGHNGSEGSVQCKPTPVISKTVALKFLMARKFDVQRALDLYRQYQVVCHSEGLDGLDPHSQPLSNELASGKFTVLDTKDLNGATIALLTGRLHYSDKGAELKRSTALQSILFQLDAAISSRDTQRNGLIVVYDMSAIRWINSDMKLARHLLDILKGGFPARLKKILIVDAPPWFEFPFRLARPFLTAKMLERLYILPSSHLIQHIAIESLPQSLGGRYKHDHQKWLQTCLSRMEGQDKMHSSSHENQGWNNRNGLSMDHEEIKRVRNGENGLDANPNGDGLEESKLAMSVSIHRRSDKGMGIVDFVRLIRSMGKDGILKEYDVMRSAARALPDKYFTAFKLPENKGKNRYVDVPCFDEGRVKLQHGAAGDDYIHANFVDGYEQKNAFISTQGPLPKTFGDFWLMVWEQECRVIVMTTRTVERGKQKCGQYWPAESGVTVEVGQFLVSSQKVENQPHHVRTTLLLKEKKSEHAREIVHLQFTDWPDYGVPQSAASMFHFIQTMHSSQAEAVRGMKPAWMGHGTGPPILVHCSAGIGRSGSLCALDICIERLKDCGVVDVHQSVQKLRSQRCQSIQMPEQYLFCYLALVEYAVGEKMISRQEADLDNLLIWLHEEEE